MTEPLSAEHRTELHELLDRLPAAPWFASDCEGDVEVWQESALLNVSRGETGRITGYRKPASFLASNLLYEASLDTWDRGEEDGEDDDLRRDIAQFLAACRNELPALLAEVERLRQQRAALIALHEYDELIFGGFICRHCTPDDCDDPDDNVMWPCPSLRAVGVTDDEAIALIKARRDEIEKAARERAEARVVTGG